MKRKNRHYPENGRLIGEDNKIYNKVDLYKAAGSTAQPVSDAKTNITQFPPKSGRLIGEDGKLYNEVDLLSGIKGGGGGTSNYNDLMNKPSINDVMLSGNKTLTELGISGGSSIIDKLWENNISAQPDTITLIHPYTDYDALLFVLGFKSEDDVNNIRSEFILSRDIAITQSPADNLLSFTNSYGDIGATMRAYFSSALQMNKYDELQTPAGSTWDWHSVIHCIYGIKFGGLTADDALDVRSSNPVSNSAITTAINSLISRVEALEG